MMQKTLLSLCCLSLGFSANAFSATKEEKNIQQIESKVAQFRSALIDSNIEQLTALSANELNYGHSSGQIENKAQFLEKFANGDSDFVTIELKDQTIQVTDDVAIVRHKLIGTTNNKGKPGALDIGVMLIWKKQHGDWKLLARQAFKTPLPQ